MKAEYLIEPAKHKQVAPTRRWTSLFLALYLIVVFPLCFLGFGSDDDTYRVLEAGVSTWKHAAAATSRNPGYWLFEACVYVLAHLGGYVMSNLVSMACGALLLFLSFRLSARLKGSNPLWQAGCFLCTPVVLIACSSTDDYMWSLLAMAYCMEMLFEDRFVPATIGGVLTIAIRPSNAVVLAGGIAGLLIFEFTRPKEDRSFAGIIAVGMISVLAGAAPCIASYRVAGHTLAFLKPMGVSSAMLTPKMRVGRFLYKQLYLLGPLATCIVIFNLVRNRMELVELVSRNSTVRRPAFAFLGLVLANMLLFMKYPLEISYLIPGLFFFLIVSAQAVFKHQKAAAVILIAVGCQNFFTLSLAKPNAAGQATDAKASLSLQRGTMVSDVETRLRLIGCRTLVCFAENSGYPGQR